MKTKNKKAERRTDGSREEQLDMFYLREAAKKGSSTNGQAIKAPPPLDLNDHRNF